MALLKMWISLSSIACMGIAVFLILLSRHTIRHKVWKGISAFLAYFLMLLAGFIMILIILSGPTLE